MPKKITYLTLIIPFVTSAQVINNGVMTVDPSTLVSTYHNFENASTGNVLNNGEIHFYGDYKNDGLFSYSTNSTTGYVVFEGKNNDIQTLSGSSPSFFYDVLFNKTSQTHAFHLKNEIENAGTVNLHNGVVLMDKELGGAFIFLKGANHINTSDKSFVDGEVTKIGNEAFKYPIGDEGYYRFAGISAPSNLAHQYTGEYFFKDSNTSYPHRNKVGFINKINDKEYWKVNQGPNTNNSVILTLSWDERTTPAELLVNGAQNLHIVRWDENKSLWVDEGGIIDTANKTVTTPIQLDGFGIFTLASIKPNLENPGEVVIYDGVTPDGDGMNDYFIIENIQNFPNNTVTIFNRWGIEVFKTTNYDSNGNVFKGYSEGRATLNDSEKLPTGTYYYILEYEYDRDRDPRTIRKAGYLHLESSN